ncbi:MAG: hypothetical protein JNM21_00805 [Taibaiella sp.]|nr:hypothetical protein [Taibaiella sp.]
MAALKITGVLIQLCIVYIFAVPFTGLFLGQYLDFMKFGSNWMSERAATLIPGFLLFNLIIVHLLFRFRFIRTVLCAGIIAFLGAFSIFLVMEYNLAPVRDAYAIKTSVLTNAGVQLSCLGLIALIKRYKAQAPVKSSTR